MELNNFEMKFVESIINVDSDERIHNFSLRYKIRKKKIIRDYERSLYSQKPAGLLKPRYTLMAIILAAVLSVCGFGIYKFFFLNIIYSPFNKFLCMINRSNL